MVTLLDYFTILHQLPNRLCNGVWGNGTNVRQEILIGVEFFSV